jgi:hypothetical protein
MLKELVASEKESLLILQARVLGVHSSLSQPHPRYHKGIQRLFAKSVLDIAVGMEWM